MSTSAQRPEKNRAQGSALELLAKLGWHVLPTEAALALRGSTREVILKSRLIEVLQTRRFDYKGQSYPLSPSGIDQILRQLQTLGLGEGLLPANERMYRTLTLGITITEFMPDGKKHQPTIALIDWLTVANNHWDVTPALQVLSTQGTHLREAGLVAFVNGLPLVVIEDQQALAERRGQSGVSEGIAHQLRNQRGDEIPQLYVYVQLLLALGGEGRYGTTLTPPNQWARWCEEASTQTQTQTTPRRARRPVLAPAPAPAQQDGLLLALMQPARLLEFLRMFVLFDRKNGKVVARYPQYFGVRALLARVNQRKPDGSREGGVLWHTAGAGKSLTMVFFAQALVLHPSTQACRVLVVTDRLDLEDQLARNFLNSGALDSTVSSRKEGEKAKASTGRELARRISKGTERIVFTLIHKFVTASRLSECFNPSADLIVLADEAHRSHGGEMHERMRKALPRAACVAFTGTPLLKKDKTAQQFGPIVHAYTLQRAVEDGSVAPLLCEERVPELTINEQAVNRWFQRISAGQSPQQAIALRRRFASTQVVYGAAQRIELIAWDIAQHFSEHIGRLGLKGQVATACKLDAIHYKRCLDATGLVSSAILMSPPEFPEGHSEQDESRLPQVQEWWDSQVGRDAEAYEAQVLQGFSGDGDPDLLIVVDRLLTGFDEPRNTVLYIDKPLKDHSLIQAVSRVNRLHEAKRFGLLVDYRGVLRDLNAAMRAYQDLETRTFGGFEPRDIEGLYRPISTEYQRLPALHDALWAVFPEVTDRADTEVLRQLLLPRRALDEVGHVCDTSQPRRERFFAALTAFGQCLHTALSSRSFFEDPGFCEATLQTYKQRLRFFTELRALAREDARDGTADAHAHELALRQMVDAEVIGHQVRETAGVYLLQPPVQEQGADAWSEEKSRKEADLIRTRLTKTVVQDLAGDPFAQKFFAEHLQQAIAQAEAMFEHPSKQYALLRKLEERLDARALDGLPKSLAEHPQARAYFGVWRLALGEEAFAQADVSCLAEHAMQIDEVVRQAVAEHSLNPRNVDAAIRKALLPRFFESVGLAKAREAVEQIMQIAHLGLARREPF